jgi:hypothetical protein
MDVEMTAEREAHIAERHPELLPAHRARLAEIIVDPDFVRRSARSSTARVLSRWYSDVARGRHFVVVVERDRESRRCWVVTAYVARRLAAGEIEWQRN